MLHPNFETRHPLQVDDQETGIDPLQNYIKNKGGFMENRRTKTSSEPEGTFSSYRKEWEELFLHSNYLARIRQKGLNGQLRSSRFRSICWKLYLEVLPEDKRQWINKTVELRAQYEKIKETHITNPRKAAGQQDLLVNNPLSQDEGSLWNRFFQDKELRAMVQQDVMRTFPEMQYFQQESVRNMLTDILFCYARENEQLLYKQGMHELLAPIVFILHCDHQAFQHASETAHSSEEMKTLLNPEYHEHDAYAMFSQLMETAEPWFSSFERELRKGKEEMITSIPFARPQDTGPSVAIVAKVNRIQDQLLKKHDIELYMHLNRLEIAPQIYGIRWVRLLFGREFPLQDLLILWDALFADSITLDLVDYIFVAMLLYIRDVLIASNYQTCLGLLMHYPPIGDIHALLYKALFLRDPKNFPRPVNYQFHQNLDYYKTRGADLMNKTRATAKAAPLNINKVSSSLLNFGRKLIAPAISANPGSIAPGVGDGPAAPHQTLVRSMVEPSLGIQQQQQHQQHRLMKSESMPVHLSKDVFTGGDAQVSVPVQTVTDIQGQSTKNISSSPSIESLPGGREYAASPPLSATKKDSFFNISRSRSHSKTMGKKELDEDLEAQISFLQGQLNDLEAMCKYSAKMMNVHIVKIQEVILQEQLEKEDEVLVALAGLKQIKDILKGSLRFNQSHLEAEENEEITISDDHYCSNSHAAENNVDQEKSQFVRTQEATSQTSLNSESRSSDDYILLCHEDDDLDDQTAKGPSSIFPGDHPHSYFPRKGKVILKSGEDHKPNPSFSDPLMGPTSASSSTSGSSPDDDSSNSKDSDFTIVNPMDI
ncbi:TBC1 domain family member 5 isoform X1 [Erpetoichthys calabaricus]|uniref:TBC1 domain family member 5 n=1 Tax=Erpetoichthys calabaricus TaxID=27687 RepID=A0A8C4TCA6_ERPCA|nr:TBC1 domain family member 5 isoform X1 [Erpetoichthys calabaricus]XP_051791863.1 TBC1 domain family member 5 isoform X1 [Erpetoichthys calabaricus]XP_051791865.1 TBC1 domain family member 5 isoform X1 [Erpetoichthys calabaricus]XP_051791866.1 TBC1 domain family member 5 isoform X1 [Erpetoichthys calabaricus]